MTYGARTRRPRRDGTATRVVRGRTWHMQLLVYTSRGLLVVVIKCMIEDTHDGCPAATACARGRSCAGRGRGRPAAS